VTRDFLKEKKDFQWYAGGDLTALGGVRIQGVGGAMRKIAWADGSSCDAEHLPGLILSTSRAHVLASDENGHPALLENRIGAGKVWLLTVGDYWGAASLDSFRSLMTEKLTSTLRITTRVTGECSDVDWHVYDCPGGWKRIVLLNTDWTSAGNAKRVVLEADQLKLPLKVIEGSLRQVLIRDGVALVFTTPGVSVTPRESGAGNLSMKVAGVGKIVMHLESKRGIARLILDGRARTLPSDGNIVIEFGEQWKEMPLEVVLR
jgi:hypothetical protein